MKQLRTKTHLTILVALIAVIALTLSACTKKPEEKKDEVIKIGAILPLTGNLGFMGEAEKNGMLVAEKIINEEGGVLGKHIKLILEDSSGKPKEALSAANKLINIEKTNILITSTTGVSRAVASLLQNNEFMLSAFCMDPSIQRESPNLVRLYYSMGQEAGVILKYFQSLSIKGIRDIQKGVAILYVQHAGAEQQLNDYFLPGFKNLGIKVVYAEPYQFTQKDFKDNIIKIKNSGAKYLVIIGYGFVYPTIFKHLEEMHIRKSLKIIGGWGFIAQNNLPKELLEDVIVAVPKYIIQKNNISKKFIEKYESVFRATPNFDSALAFENIWLISKAIERAKSTDVNLIAKALSNQYYKGVMGKTFIDRDGGLEIPMSIGLFRNGEIIELEPKIEERI